jgi:hypothetical protein
VSGTLHWLYDEAADVKIMGFSQKIATKQPAELTTLWQEPAVLWTSVPRG